MTQTFSVNTDFLPKIRLSSAFKLISLNFPNLKIFNMFDPRRKKTCFLHMRKTKAQISCALLRS